MEQGAFFDDGLDVAGVQLSGVFSRNKNSWQ
jgi:hypothetical protein